MKKRLMALILAVLMLCSVPVSTAFAGSDGEVWLRGREYFEGGELTYGTVELRSGSEYIIADFVYGYGVSVSEKTMQDIALSLSASEFPMLTIPYDSAKPDDQRFFVMSAKNPDDIDALILSIENMDSAEEETVGENGQDTTVSSGDVSQTEENTLSEDELLTLIGIFSQYAVNTDGQAVSDSDVSGSDVSGSDVSGSDVISDSDVSGSDVSDSDALPESSGIVLSDEEQQALMDFFDLFGFGDGTENTDQENEADQSGAASASDASGDEAEGTGDTGLPSEDAEEEDGSSVQPPENVTDYVSVYSLIALREGAAQLKALPTLEDSLAAAFPEFSFGAAETVVMRDPNLDNIVLSESGASAQVMIHPEPEYIDVELNGTVFTVLLMSEKDTGYMVSRVRFNGIAGAATTTVTTTTAATTAETTTTTTITTTTTTTATTAATTTTTAATTTTTTTTTTTAATTATTSVRKITGYVSTQSLDLNVRKGPGTGYSSICLIPKGTEVTILDMSNDEWYFIRLNDGTEGYVYSYYITVNP